MIKAKILIVSLFSFFSTHCYALTWEKSQIEIVAEQGTEDIAIEFPFQNKGENPVQILDLKASCGCTAPTVKSKVIPAGEKSVLRVDFTIGNRVGPQNFQIVVTTDEKNAARTVLQLHVDIHPMVLVTPLLVHWSKADGLSEKTIELTKKSQGAVRIVSVTPQDDKIQATLIQGKEPDTWNLKLKPKSVDTPFTSKVDIQVEGSKQTVTYSVFAMVR